MSKFEDDQDLKDVLREERSRGRKRVDIEAEKRERKQKAELLNIFYHGSEDDFRQLLRSLGFSEKDIEEKVKIFRDERAKL